MKAPEWVCSVICANLDIEELVKDENIYKLETNETYLKKDFSVQKSSNDEENNQLNINGDQIH